MIASPSGDCLARDEADCMPSAGSFHSLDAESLAPPQLRALQLAKWERLLEAALRSPFYRKKWRNAGVAIDGAVTFDQIPLLEKSELLDDQRLHPPYGSHLTLPLSAFSRFHQTSGSSGSHPLRFLDTTESWSWMLGNWSAIFRAAGVTPADRVGFMFSFGPFLGFWSAFDAAARYGTLCFPAGGLSTTARLRFILDNGLTVLCCTPTYALRMAEVAEAEKINIALSPVRLLVVAGEPGGSIPQTRARIEEAWGARCVDHYGMTETGPAALECEKVRGRLHVIESEFIAEIIDSAGKPAPDSEPGELVLTPLGRNGSPVIRYRTGDIVRATRHTPCECGRSFLSLEGGILGRADDMVVIRGVNVYPSAVEEILHRIPGIAEYQVEVTTQRGMSELAIRFESHDDGRTVAAALSRELEHAFGLRVAVEHVPDGKLPRFEMKARRWKRN